MIKTKLKVGHDYNFFIKGHLLEPLVIRYQYSLGTKFSFINRATEEDCNLTGLQVEEFVGPIPKNARKKTYPKNNSSLETQVGGNHYKALKIQPWEIIIANKLGFFDGNVLKYILRYKTKNGLEDLKKCKHYLEALIEQTENEPAEVE